MNKILCGSFFITVFTQILAVLCYSNNKSYFILSLSLFCFIPISVAILLREYFIKNYKADYKAPLSCAVCLIIIIDMVHFFIKSEILYQFQKHPHLEFNLPTHFQKPFQPNFKALLPLTVYPEQSMRYASLITKTPSIFSPLMKAKDIKSYVPSGLRLQAPPKPEPDNFEYGLKSVRWNSFLLPKNYFYLIHSNITPKVMAEMFAFNQPSFQLKKGAILLSSENIKAQIDLWGADRSVLLLKQYFFLEDSLFDSRLSQYKNLLPASGANLWDPIRGDIKTQSSDYNSYELFVESNASGFLYWADGYDKFWKAVLNGKERPIFRANINFKAIQIDSGTNRVQFIYDPKPFRYSLYLFYGLFFISLTGGFFILTRIIQLESGIRMKIWPFFLHKKARE